MADRQKPDSKFVRKAPNPTGKGGFKKGQSGNPGGRRNTDPEFLELCRSKSPEMLRDLVKRWNALGEKTQLALLEFTAAYAYGKPTQAIDMAVTHHEDALDELE